MTTTVERTSLVYPRYGYYMALAAAVLFFIQGIMMIFFSSIVYALIISLGVGVAAFLLGILMVVLALIVGSSALGLRSYPERHVALGASIIVFSLIALFMGGGYLIGTVLGIIGGILAIMSI